MSGGQVFGRRCGGAGRPARGACGERGCSRQARDDDEVLCKQGPALRRPTRLQALLPGVEVQRGELAKVGVAHVHVERLALVDVRTAVCRRAGQHSGGWLGRHRHQRGGETGETCSRKSRAQDRKRPLHLPTHPCMPTATCKAGAARPKGPTCRHVHQYALLDLPHRLVQRLEVVRDVQVLRSRMRKVA